ncbi:YitT family protein [Paenibacillus sp. MSJ-34]|nr:MULTISPECIES: YitT family protein [unclassified Paenibacillus]MBU5444677.1 YitT family protein [Paenibacillus sp. MSJ-34]
MRSLKRWLAIIAGSLMIAIGINYFLIPFSILDGGIIGIALIAKYLWGAKVGLTMIVCSIPIFMLAWFRYRPYFYLSFPGMLISSLFTDALYPSLYYFTYYVKLSPLMSAAIGGIFMGGGLGVMLRYETSTGGTDLVAKFIADYYLVNVGFTIFIIDGMIVTLGGMLFSAETFLLSVVTIFVGGIVTGLCCLNRNTLHSGPPAGHRRFG